jgi:DNA-directed RNA polymerase specialized sigma24 family protein
VYAREAKKELRDRWRDKYWYDHDYGELFADAADETVLSGLRVITGLPPQMRRVFEARRVYGFRVQPTAERLGISPNSIGSCTAKAEARISEVTDLKTILKFFDDQMEGGS